MLQTPTEFWLFFFLTLLCQEEQGLPCLYSRTQVRSLMAGTLQTLAQSLMGKGTAICKMVARDDGQAGEGGLW